MGVSHAVFGFYIQLARPFKQRKKKLSIIFVLCAKSLDGTNSCQWTWLKCANVITNNTNNLLCQLDNNHSGVAISKSLVGNKKKKVSVESVP